MNDFLTKRIVPAITLAAGIAVVAYILWPEPNQPSPSVSTETGSSAFSPDPELPGFSPSPELPRTEVSRLAASTSEKSADSPEITEVVENHLSPSTRQVVIKEGPAAGLRLSIPKPEDYLSKMPSEHAAEWADFQQDHPDVDPTDTDSFHQALLEERARFPIHLGDRDREAYGNWLNRVEAMAESMVRARAELLAVPVSGTDEDGTEYLLSGFHGAVPLYAMGANREAAVSSAASFVRRNADFNSEFGPEIDGSGFFVNVNDTRLVAEHPEFQSDDGQSWRLTPIRGSSAGGHATHVAGTIAARGLNPRAKGMAPAAHVYSLTNTQTGDVFNLGMNWPGRPERAIAGNSSLGTFNSALNGVYTSTSAGFDQAHFDTPYYLHFYAAGNSGPEFFSLSTTRKDAKNVFAVGNVTDVTRNELGVRTGGGSIANSSARGPTRDGRVKPDIVANGIGLFSTNAEMNYDSRSGTSMASPNAAGSAILLQDYFNKRFDGHLMRASTLMALIINTTDEMGTAGPNYTSGWGLMNTLAAGRIIQAYAANPNGLELMEDRLYDGEAVEITFTSDATQPIRATLVWTDPPGPARTSNTQTDPVLVNNLNLRLIGPDGTAHYPFVMPYVTGTTSLPPFSQSLLSFPATTGVNFTDNKIQVRINTPLPGDYTVEITHEDDLTGGFQNYSLAVSGITANVPATAPIISNHSEGGLSDAVFVPLTIEGEGFLLGADVEFRRSGFESVRAYAHEVTGRQILARVNHSAMAPGDWELVVRNPDGLETVSSQTYTLDAPLTHTWTGAAGNDLLFSNAGFANWNPALTSDQLSTSIDGTTGNTFVLNGGTATPATASGRLSVSVSYANIGRLIIDNNDGLLPDPLLIGANQPGSTAGRILRFTLPNTDVITLTENVTSRVAIGTNHGAHGFLGIRVPETGTATFHVAHPDAVLDFSELLDNWTGRGAVHSGSTNQEDDRGRIRKTGSGTLNLAVPDGQGNRVQGLTIEGGSVVIGKNPDMGWLPSSTMDDHVVINGGTLHFNNLGTNTGATRGFQIGAQGGGFKLTGANHAMLGVIADMPDQMGVLIKKGDTALRLANANTYSGGTVVREGRLRYTVTDSLGSGPVILEEDTWISAWQSGIGIANDLEIEGDSVGLGGDGHPTIWEGNIDLMEGVRTLRIADDAFFHGTLANGGLTLAAESSELALHLNGENLLEGPLTVSIGQLHAHSALPALEAHVKADGLLIAGADTADGDWQLVLEGGEARLLTGDITFGLSEISGYGAVVGSPRVNQLLQPGTETSTGTLTINGNLHLAEDAVARFKIGADGQQDHLSVSGGALWDGTVQVVLADGFVPSAGQEFAIISVGETASGGGSLVFSLPSPGPGLAWETSSFLDDGTLTVVPDLFEITLHQDFDNGALLLDQSSVDGDWIFIDGPDNFNPGGWKWIYFRVEGAVGRELRFRIGNNFATGSSRLSDLRMVYREEGGEWEFFDRNVLDNDAGHFTFYNEVPFATDSVEVAFSFPYPVSRVSQHVAAIRESPYVFPTASSNADLVLGQSPGGIDDRGRQVPPQPLYGFLITDPDSPFDKERIVLCSGVHSNEVLANFVLEGLIDWLLGPDPRAGALRERVEFYVYPMVNPDGRYAGYNRGNVQWPSRDTNRVWREDLYEDMDDIRQIAEAMIADTGAENVTWFFDFHSWSNTINHFTIMNPPTVETVFWRELQRLEPDMGQSVGTPSTWQTRRFAVEVLNATYGLIPETMFRPGEYPDRYLAMGKRFGVALFHEIDPPGYPTTGANVLILTQAGDPREADARRLGHWLETERPGDFRVDYSSDLAINVLQSLEVLTETRAALLNLYDLIIVPPAGAGPTEAFGNPDWNALTVPILNLDFRLVGPEHWNWFSSSATVEENPGALVVADPLHPLLQGIDTGSGQVTPWSGAPPPVLLPDTGTQPGNGRVAGWSDAEVDGINPLRPWLVEWEALGKSFHAGTSQAPASRRIFFAAPAEGNFPENLSPAGRQLLLNAADRARRPRLLMLVAEGHSAEDSVRRMGEWIRSKSGGAFTVDYSADLEPNVLDSPQSLSPAQMKLLNRYDLILMPRFGVGSAGDFSSSDWNLVTTPLINMNPFSMVEDNWGWIPPGTSTPTSPPPVQRLFTTEPAHPVFEGLSVSGDELRVFPEPLRIMQVELDSENLNGRTLGITDREENGLNQNFPWLQYWDGTETTFHQNEGTQSPGGRRMLLIGPRLDTPNPFTLDGRLLLLNAIAWMATKPDTRGDAPEVEIEAPRGIPTDGLTAYWTFDGTLDNAAFASPPASSNLNLAAFGEFDFDENGLLGQAARFDGEGAHLRIDGGGQVVGDDPLEATISVWFKADRAPSGTERFFIYESAPGYPLSLGLRAGTAGNTRLQLFTHSPTDADQNIVVQVPNEEIAGQWVHAVTTIRFDEEDPDNNSFSLIVNGGEARGGASASAALTVSELADFDNFHIGTFRSANGRWFPGLIDEFAIWNRLLNEDEQEGLFRILDVTVTTAADEDDGFLGGGSGVSLREAINHAPAGATITFVPGLSGQTITLTQGQLLIEKSLTIDASELPDGLTIDANGEITGHRVMEITPGNTVALHSLTLTGGNAMGPSPDNRGGGILNFDSALTLIRCTITGNSAFTGAGIESRGTPQGTARLTLTACTFHDNHAGLNGGAIYNDERPGSQATLSLTSCTLSGNSAFNLGGGIHNNGPLTTANSTLTGNTANMGGGIFHFSSENASLTLANSIIASNTAGAMGPDIFTGESITAEGVNLLSDLADSGLSQGSAILVAANPRLAPLGDYGGPTATMPPLPDSPAVNAGGLTDLTTDQRGLPRPVGSAPDIGAVEFQGQPDLTRFWNTDFDGDGRPFGLEFATGTDPLDPAPGTTGGIILPVPSATGGVSLGFPFNPQAAGLVRWTLESSPDLSPGSWSPVFRSTDPEDSSTWDIPDDISVTIDAGSGTVSIDDERSADRAFYRLTVAPALP